MELPHFVFYILNIILVLLLLTNVLLNRPSIVKLILQLCGHLTLWMHIMQHIEKSVCICFSIHMSQSLIVAVDE